MKQSAHKGLVTMIRVQADIVDLRKDNPINNDSFFVDTNVWYWMGYLNAGHQDGNVPQNYQLSVYPTYIATADKVGSKLFVCTLSFAELTHTIERNELEIFNKSKGLKVGTKRFRQDYPIERASVIADIEYAWDVAEKTANGNILEINVAHPSVSDAITRLKSETLDGYDVFMIEAMMAKGIDKVITDDQDFGSIAGITVFTANKSLIDAARTQRKLKKR